MIIEQNCIFRELILILLFKNEFPFFQNFEILILFEAKRCYIICKNLVTKVVSVYT